jgi:hypothetical protein
VNNPWERLRRGLVLGGEELYEKARRLLEKKGGVDGARWTAAEEATEARARVRKLVALENNVRIQVWARVRLGGERSVDLAREYGYQDGSGVRQVVKRLEASAKTSRPLRAKLQELYELSRVKRLLKKSRR